MEGWLLDLSWKGYCQVIAVTVRAEEPLPLGHFRQVLP